MRRNKRANLISGLIRFLVFTLSLTILDIKHGFDIIDYALFMATAVVWGICGYREAKAEEE